MANRDSKQAPEKRNRREQKKQEVVARINDVLIALICEDADINHDVVAERTGLGRRTIYRYFPDRAALLESVWSHIGELAGDNVVPPKTEEDLLASISDIHKAFDRMAPIITLIQSTMQGRAIRLASNKKRIADYTAAAANAVKGLPRGDRKSATAVLQVLHSVSWLEMHDQWQLTGEETARAVAWAIRALLADLHARDGEPLDQPLAATPVENSLVAANGRRRAPEKGSRRPRGSIPQD